ncbi:MAG: tRNA lysidine(34) synthetase TilS [Candidatus Izimaplasma sp.]|nr:tRNA lysidine(34) synthetase TilS [Candidatus Izimaplasma bacterium]
MLKNFNENLIKKNDKLVLAVSGGVDSMVMLDYLAKLINDYKLELFIVHVNHQKRDNSQKDAAFVKKMAQTLNLPFFLLDLKKNEEGNFHHYAHKKRYQFFLEVANKVGAKKIVLAHNLNDLAETILMRLTRGSSFEGYRGILEKTTYKNKTIIRPMLYTSKNDILDYQKRENVKYREDSSNLEDDYTRNRFRHNILPKLQKENPQYLEKLKQFSEYQTMAYNLIESLSKTYFQSLEINKDKVIIDKKNFLNQLDIIQFEVIKMIINHLTRNALEISFTNIKDIIELICNKKPNLYLKLAQDLHIYKSYGKIFFQNEPTEYENFEITIDDFNKYDIVNEFEVIITKNLIKNYDYMYKLCYNSLDSVFPFLIRNRRDGDRIDINVGTKKLKDFFIDKKVSINARNTLPIMINKNNEIFFIPSLYKLKSEGKNTLYIYVNKL